MKKLTTIFKSSSSTSFNLSKITLINMKKHLFVLAICMIGATACFSIPKDSANLESLEIPLHSNFNRIYIGGRVTVIFVGNEYKNITVNGKSRDISKVKIQLRGNLLSIQANKPLSDRGVTVYVPVSQVNDIAVDGDANLFSNTILDAKKITLSLKGNITARLNTAAQLIIKEDLDYDMEYSTSNSLADANGNHSL